MDDRDLPVDRKCHVIYSRQCKAEIIKKIALHYPEGERDAVWERMQNRFCELLSTWRTDLGGAKNFHNGAGGTYDNIALMCYYTVCREKTSLAEIEDMLGNIFLPSFRRLAFVDVNKPFWRRLLYRAFLGAKGRCDRWGDFEMHIEPYSTTGPMRYYFTTCPVAEFAKKYGLQEVMPALCNVDFAAMELLHARLVRPHTLMDSDKCDYAICGDREEYARQHPEYRDEKGYRRNR